METVTILRGLWRRRLLVAFAFFLALFAGTTMGYRISFPPKLESRSYHVGVATSRIFIDTPSSQVVEVSPKGGDTLGTRAGLIASLMTDGTVKATIARRAGLQPQQFDAVSSSASESTPAVAPPSARSSVLTTSVVTNTSGDELPIIQIEAQAADAQTAARLASAAVIGLRDYLNSKAALQRIPDAKRLQVDGLGAPQARDVVRGPRRLVALVIAILVFLAGCAAIIAFSTIAKLWRAASEEDTAEDVVADPALHALRGRADEERGEPATALPTRGEPATALPTRGEPATALPTPAERLRKAPSPWR